MYKKIKPLFLICETPLHAGSGSDLGIVDLPIQRERHTSFPKIEASSLKGALREALESNLLATLRADKSNKEDVRGKLIELNKVFGYDNGALKGFSKEDMEGLFDKDKKEFAGCIGFTDARLLLFPVKSLYGVFAWITCPRVIKRFITDLKLDGELPFNFNEKDGIKKDTVPSASKSLFDEDNRIRLEEFIFDKIVPEDRNSNLDNIANWLSDNVFKGCDAYWKDKVKTDIVVLDDTDFRDFVNLSTEVITRTKINNETGTVQNGALFSEEYLPAESLMYSMAMFTDEFNAQNPINTEGVLEFFECGLKNTKNIIQVGGNATLGKGIIRTAFVNQ
jgi:CRISPR-associated protein Cmr4